ncbi:ergosterol biosynthetic protein 28 homolog isoform X2 [Manis pentadactyla]|uniref:ergosterol biosynthetic protein 28 homolog isoform X2 n=1 Tax=Manis pentadactyla TaxID=143292 RepID=UPI00255C7A87|nr:ergosterol biosynthetic protein 28 homolog isoform X2 [Manis pentadactyla]
MAHVDPGPQLSWGACKPPGLLCFGSGHQISRVVGRKERQKALSGLREVMSRFLNVLRSWLVMVSIIAMGNTLQSFRDHTFLYEKLYTGKPNLVNGLQARTFGIWTLLSSVIRCLCAVDIHNKTLYHVTLWTFLLALGHFLSELFVYGTAAPTIGVLAPLMVASFSILGMLVGLRYLEAEPVSRQKRN